MGISREEMTRFQSVISNMPADRAESFRSEFDKASADQKEKAIRNVLSKAGKAPKTKDPDVDDAINPEGVLAKKVVGSEMFQNFFSLEGRQKITEQASGAQQAVVESRSLGRTVYNELKDNVSDLLKRSPNIEAVLSGASSQILTSIPGLVENMVIDPTDLKQAIKDPYGIQDEFFNGIVDDVHSRIVDEIRPLTDSIAGQMIINNFANISAGLTTKSLTADQKVGAVTRAALEEVKPFNLMLTFAATKGTGAIDDFIETADDYKGLTRISRADKSPSQIAKENLVIDGFTKKESDEILRSVGKLKKRKGVKISKRLQEHIDERSPIDLVSNFKGRDEFYNNYAIDKYQSLARDLKKAATQNYTSKNLLADHSNTPVNFRNTQKAIDNLSANKLFTGATADSQTARAVEQIAEDVSALLEEGATASRVDFYRMNILDEKINFRMSSSGDLVVDPSKVNRVSKLIRESMKKDILEAIDDPAVAKQIQNQDAIYSRSRAIVDDLTSSIKPAATKEGYRANTGKYLRTIKNEENLDLLTNAELHYKNQYNPNYDMKNGLTANMMDHMAMSSKYTKDFLDQMESALKIVGFRTAVGTLVGRISGLFRR